MRIVGKAHMIIILVSLGLAGVLLAAGSLLSACGASPNILLYIPGGWLTTIFSYCGWAVGGMIAFGSYVALVRVFKCSKGFEDYMAKMAEKNDRDTMKY